MSPLDHFSRFWRIVRGEVLPGEGKGHCCVGREAGTGLGREAGRSSSHLEAARYQEVEGWVDPRWRRWCRRCRL